MLKLPPEQVESLVGELSGQDVIPLVRVLRKSKNISEFKLAERMKLGINQVRNMLYRMNEHNLVTSTRKKDKKKGWYIYYWTFSEFEADQLLLLQKQKKLKDLEHRLSVESSEAHYVCKDDKLRLDSSAALEYDFRCPECNNLLEIENKDKLLKNLKRDIELTKEELNQVQIATEEERKRVENMVKKELEKEALAHKKALEKSKKDAAVKRAAAKEAKNAAKPAKVAKKSAKKVPAKKVVAKPAKPSAVKAVKQIKKKKR